MQTATKLPVYIKAGWAIGELGIATYVGITMIYLLFFMTQALDVSPFLAGIALLIPRLWDVITDPIMGAISDRTNTRIGRRRPYLLAGALLFGGSFYLIFAVPSFDSEIGRVAYVTVMYLIASSAYTIYDVPYSSMAAEMTGDYGERTNLTGYKMMAARLGIVIAVTAGPFIFTSQETLAEGFRLMGLILGVYMVVTGLVAFFTTAAAPRQTTELHALNLREELQAVLQNRPFRVLWLVFLFQNLAIGASATTLIYLVTFVLQADVKVIGPLIAIGSIVGLLVTPVWVYVARRIGKRGSYFVGMGITAGMTLPALVIPPELYFVMFAVLLVAGIGDAATQLCPNSMIPDTVEVDELRTGKRREGAIFGAWAFCRKLGMAAGAFLVSVGLSLFGFESGEAAAQDQTSTALLGIRITYALLPLSLWVAAILTLRRYDLSESRFNAVKAEIARHDATPAAVAAKSS